MTQFFHVQACLLLTARSGPPGDSALRELLLAACKQAHDAAPTERELGALAELVLRAADRTNAAGDVFVALQVPHDRHPCLLFCSSLLVRHAGR